MTTCPSTQNQSRAKLDILQKVTKAKRFSGELLGCGECHLHKPFPKDKMLQSLL